MANFFSDNKDLQFHLQHPMMRKIVELKERGFAEKDLYDFAPQDFEDAMDSYRRVLEIAGEVCGEVIAPNAEGVDHEGPRVVNDHVEYAAGTVQNMKAIVDAGLSRPYAAPQVRRSELPAGLLRDGQRDGRPRRCRLREHLGFAGLCRDAQRVRLGRAQGQIPAVGFRGRYLRHGSHRTGCGFRPGRRDAQGYVVRGEADLAAERRQALHHQRRRRRFARAGAYRRGYHRRPRAVDARL